MFWKKNSTHVNMENSGHCNVRKHREIRNGKQYVILEISLKFGNVDKIKMTYLKTKYYLGRSGKGLITSLDLKAVRRSKNVKKEKFTINEVSLKDIF